MLWLKKFQLKMGGAGARLEAIQQIAASGDPHAVDALIEALQEKDMVPVQAAKALGLLRDPRAVPALTDCLKSDQAYLQEAAAQALGKIGPPAVAALANLLKDADQSLQELAARTLGEVGIAALVPLTNMLTYPLKNVREAAVDGLSKIHDARAVPPLLTALEDEEESVREKAGRGLVQIGKPAVPLLLPLLTHPNPTVRHQAIWALERLGWEALEDEMAVRPLAFGKWKDVKLGQGALDIVIAALRGPDVEAHLAAVKALANIGDVRAVPGLARALDDLDPAVRDVAYEALAKIGPEALDPLLTALKGEGPDLRRRIARVLGTLGTDRALGPLQKLLQDPDPAARSTAAEALGALSEPAAKSALFSALKDADPAVRFAAVGALWRIGDASFVDPLLPMLNDADAQTRLRTAQALGNIGDKRVIAPLLKLFEADEEARLEAALAVAKIVPAKAVRPLLQLTEAAATAGEAIEILTEIVQTVPAEIATEDLQVLVELPEKMKDLNLDGPGDMLKEGPDPSRLSKLAMLQLSRFPGKPAAPVRTAPSPTGTVPKPPPAGPGALERAAPGPIMPSGQGIAPVVISPGSQETTPKPVVSTSPSNQGSTPKPVVPTSPSGQGMRPPDGIERRSWPRQRSRSVGVLISDADHQAPPVRGWVLDASATGLGITIGKSFPTEAILSVRPSRAAETFPWFQVEVRYCKKTAEGWRVGCRFVVPPTPKEWMAFV